MTTLRLATRGSRLALVQTATVASLLERAHPGLHCEPVVVSTRGDRHLDVPSDAIAGGPGVFTKEAEEAVLSGRAEAAVHSAKDLPTELLPGMAIAAVPERVDPRDALVGCSLEALPTGAVVATDSPRRRAQLLALRPDLRFTLLRGNVETRLAKLESREVDALVLAMAGLLRLDLAGRPDIHPLEPEQVLPAMGQGTLAIEVREADDATVELLAAINRPELAEQLAAERSAIRALQGGCQAAAGALACDGEITVAICSLDGARAFRSRGPLDRAEAIALRLLEEGGRECLAS